MKHSSQKRKEQLRIYAQLKMAQIPTRCRRCKKQGFRWTSEGGDFDPHHPYGRVGTWLYVFFPVCRECHEGFHAQPNKAREEGFIITPYNR